MDAPTTSLSTNLLEQLTFHWEEQVRPKLAGLTDTEYFWEPVPDMWSIRPRAEARAPIFTGIGDMVCEFAMPEPDPPPLTTIAWRLGHVIVGIFGMRNASHFGGPPVDFVNADWPGDAATALTQLDDGYARWTDGVRSLGDDRLWEPVGPAEGPYAEHPYIALVLHIHRETIHHCSEVLLLRDLYRTMVAAS